MLPARQAIVKALRGSLCDHGRRQIDTDQPIDKRTKRGTAEPRTAAEVEHGSKMHRPAAGIHQGLDGIAQQHRPAIAEAFGQRLVVAAGILVEQPADVGFGHGWRRLSGAEPRQLQPRAVVILRIGIAGMAERGNGAVTVAELIADRAKRKPCGGKARRQLDRLRQDIGGTGQIALGGVVERPFIAPVGDQIAGRNEKRASIGHVSVMGACVLSGNAYL